MIKIKVTVKLHNGNLVLTAENIVSSVQEVSYNLNNLTMWYVSTYAKSDIFEVQKDLQTLLTSAWYTKLSHQSRCVYAYFSPEIDLRIHSSLVN